MKIYIVAIEDARGGKGFLHGYADDINGYEQVFVCKEQAQKLFDNTQILPGETLSLHEFEV
ncbi:MAG: hypothetical protein ACXW1D_00510 [Halobacteriota archaeon]